MESVWDAQVMLHHCITRMLKAGLLAPSATPATGATRHYAAIRRSVGARSPRCSMASRTAGRARGATTAGRVQGRQKAWVPATGAKAGNSLEGAALHPVSLIAMHFLPALITLHARVSQCWGFGLACRYIMRRSAKCVGIYAELHAGRGPGCQMKPSAYSYKPSRT